MGHLPIATVATQVYFTAWSFGLPATADASNLPGGSRGGNAAGPGELSGRSPSHAILRCVYRHCVWRGWQWRDQRQPVAHARPAPPAV